MYYINDFIKNLDRKLIQMRRKNYLRLDCNENPGGLPKQFVRNILNSLTPESLAQYPDTIDFMEILAKNLGIEIENICLTNGSAEGIRYVYETFTSIGGKIVGVAPSYGMFETYANMLGRCFVPVLYNNDLSMSVKNIIDKLTSDTQLLILANPNNPLGNVYSKEEFKIIFQEVKKKQITLLIDEAYFYYYNHSFISFALENENVFITRTFSKAFSMAGCRLGYVVGSKKGINLIQKMCTPRNVNVLALKCAQHLIEKPEIMENLLKKQIKGKKYLIKKLKQYNYKVLDCKGNFLLFWPNTDAELLANKLKEKKILVKVFKNLSNYNPCIRVTIGNIEYMKKFINTLKALD